MQRPLSCAQHKIQLFLTCCRRNPDRDRILCCCPTKKRVRQNRIPRMPLEDRIRSVIKRSRLSSVCHSKRSLRPRRRRIRPHQLLMKNITSPPRLIRPTETRMTRRAPNSRRPRFPILITTLRTRKLLSGTGLERNAAQLMILSCVATASRRSVSITPEIGHLGNVRTPREQLTLRCSHPS